MPFNSEFKKEKSVLEQNIDCDIEWYRGNITKMPHGIINTLQKMLNKYPEKRITAEEALQIPLFDGAEKIEDLK